MCNSPVDKKPIVAASYNLGGISFLILVFSLVISSFIRLKFEDRLWVIQVVSDKSFNVRPALNVDWVKKNLRFRKKTYVSDNPHSFSKRNIWFCNLYTVKYLNWLTAIKYIKENVFTSCLKSNNERNGFWQLIKPCYPVD